MTQSIYQFNLLASNSSSNQPVLSLATNVQNEAEASLQVRDVNNDGLLNAQDDFILTRGEQSFQLSGEEGLKALNYFVAPTQLRATHHRVELSTLEQEPQNQALIGNRNTTLESLNDQGYINDSLVAAINQTVSEWTLDGNIPLSLLTGTRTFTDAENAQWRERPNPFSTHSFADMGRWLTTRGGAHLFTQRFATEDTLRKVFVIGSLFAALGGIAGGLRGPAYGELAIWMVFTSNYVACELGILNFFRPNNDAAIHSLANVTSVTQRIAVSSDLVQLTNENHHRLESNIEIITRRMDAARRDRFFGFSRPFIFGIIAFVDPQSRGWFWHNFNIFKPLIMAKNLVNFREKSIIGFFARMGSGVVRNCVAGGLPSMALGLGIAVTAGYGIWGLGNVWYPFYSSAYGPLPYESSFTRTYSAISAVFSTTWLMSAAQDQLHRIIGYPAYPHFRPSNLRLAYQTIRSAPVINRQGFESLYRAAEGVREYPVVKGTIFRFLTAVSTWASNRIPALARGLSFLSTRNAQLEKLLVPAVDAPRVGALIALGIASVGGAAIIAAYLSGRYHDDRTMLDDLRELGVHI